MKPTAQQLALRDPAIAALMGVSALGADFGSEFGDPDDDDDDYGAEFGDPDDDDDDYGAEFGAARRLSAARFMAMRPPTAQALQRMWRQKAVTGARRQQRILRLDPNRGSGVKVERYTLALSQDLVIATAAVLTMQQQPDTTFRPQEMVCNAPAPGFATVAQIRMANVGILAGGTLDAWNFGAGALRGHMDLPTLSPANRATITGNYTGFAAGYPVGLAFTFSVSFTGPASLAGGASI